MPVNSLKDVSYHHHWKVMTIIAAIMFVGIPLAFLEHQHFLAVVLIVDFFVVLVQWLTIDPPDVTDEDVYGAPSKRPE
jgi:hypothetical protein